MGKAEDRNKHQKMAEDLRKRGIFHGKRLSKPYPNSGGEYSQSWVSRVGSAAYQRLMRHASR